MQCKKRNALKLEWSNRPPGDKPKRKLRRSGNKRMKLGLKLLSLGMVSPDRRGLLEKNPRLKCRGAWLPRNVNYAVPTGTVVESVATGI